MYEGKKAVGRLPQIKFYVLLFYIILYHKLLKYYNLHEHLNIFMTVEYTTIWIYFMISLFSNTISFIVNTVLNIFFE